MPFGIMLSGMAETWDVIRSRRNVRTYTDQPIPAADLDRILEVARRTPSASNRQHWDFVVVTDRGQLERLATVWQGARHIAGSAATIALVVPVSDDERTTLTDYYDLGQVTYAITIAAADLGIGSGHSSIGDQALAREVLGGVPDDHRVAYLIGLGYPADRPLTPIEKLNRRPFAEVVHRGHW
jgi:nitroreductase